MAQYPALPLFTDAYMADTRHLTAAQHGAYLLLLMTAWRMPDCKLPNDDKFLARCAAMDLRTWKANKEVVLSFWKLDDEQKFRQDRLLDERKYADDMRRKNSEAGKSSALKRLHRSSTTVQPNCNEIPTPIPIPIVKKDSAKALSKEKVSLEELSVGHIAEWLTLKRSKGKYLNHDEHTILERFKDYCNSKGKKYHDYIAAYRNAFEWDSNQPRPKPKGDPATNALNAAQSIIARRNAAAGICGSAEPANNPTATNLCLPEDVCR